MKAGKIGTLSAALASACCVGPLLLAALGLGSLGLGAALGKYHWVLQGAAVVGLTCRRTAAGSRAERGRPFMRGEALWTFSIDILTGWG